MHLSYRPIRKIPYRKFPDVRRRSGRSSFRLQAISKEVIRLQRRRPCKPDDGDEQSEPLGSGDGYRASRYCSGPF